MEDRHFLERLERVSSRHVELALGLYRDPDLIRFVLASEHVPDVPRVAISLDDPHEGPFLVVTRDGHFVTCLGRGMRPGDLPIVTRARLDRLGERHEALRARLAYCEAALSDASAGRKLMRALMRAAHRLPREAMSSLTMLAPLILDTLHEKDLALEDAVNAFMGTSGRYLTRRHRLSSGDLERLEAFWIDVWSLGHVTLLVHAQEPEVLDRRHARFMEVGPEGSLGLILPALGMPFWPLTARGLWAAARLGKRVVPALKRALVDMRTLDPEGPALAMALSAVACAHPKLRAEILKTLHVGEDDPEARKTQAWRRLCEIVLKGTDDAHELVSRNRAHLYALATLYAGEQVPDVPTARAALGTPHGQQRLYWARAHQMNLFVDGFAGDNDLTMRVLSLLADLTTLAPEDFYWSASDLDIEVPWEPRMSLELVEAVHRSTAAYVAQNEPITAAPKPGRNDACTCGSGKKYKKCCGA